MPAKVAGGDAAVQPEIPPPETLKRPATDVVESDAAVAKQAKTTDESTITTLTKCVFLTLPSRSSRGAHRGYAA